MLNLNDRHNEKTRRNKNSKRLRKKHDATEVAADSAESQCIATTVPNTTMALLTWNLCGMNQDTRLKKIRTLLTTKRVEIFGLNETKIKKIRQDEVKEKLGGDDWEILTNIGAMDNGISNSIWLGWNKNIWS